MSKSRKYDEVGVINALSKVRGVKVDVNKQHIEVAKDHSAGNGTWGKIDYLTKYKGWTCSLYGGVAIRNTGGNFGNDISNLDDDKISDRLPSNGKGSKRVINMAATTKEVMKKAKR